MGAGHVRVHRHGRDRHRRDQGRADLQAGGGDAGRRVRRSSRRPSTRASSTRSTGRRSRRRSSRTSTGAKLTVVVNHLKSKGSDCNDVGDPDTGDGSGNCNMHPHERRQGARRLARDRPDRQRRSRLPADRRHELVHVRGPDRGVHDGTASRTSSGSSAGSTPTRTSSTASRATSTTRSRPPSLAAQATGVDRLAHQPRRADGARLQRRVQDGEPGRTRSTTRARTASSDHDPVVIGLDLNRAPDGRRRRAVLRRRRRQRRR